MSEFGRVQHQGRARWVRVAEETCILLDSAPWEGDPGEGEVLGLEDVCWMPPVAPSKIVAFGRNYAAHAAEQGAKVPEQPLLFLKATSSLASPGQEVLLPPESQRVECEGELALVIGKSVRRFQVGQDLGDVVAGCLVADDVTARDLQRAEGQWARGKSFDTFCPVSRTFRTGLPDLQEGFLRTWVDGELAQEARLADMVFPLDRLLAHASAAMTLCPGDLILTGTPEGVRRLEPGMEVRVAVDGLPELRHGVAAES